MSTASITFRAYASNETFRAVSFRADFTPSGDYVVRTQIVGASAEAVDIADITSPPGLLWLRALDASASVDIYKDAGATKAIGSVKHGMPMVMQPSGAIYAKNPGGNTTLEVIAFETVSDLTITHLVPTMGTGLYAYTALTATIGKTTFTTAEEHTDASVGVNLMEHVKVSVPLTTSQSIVTSPTYTGLIACTKIATGTAESEIRISSSDATQFATFGINAGLLIGNFVRPAIYNNTEGVLIDVFAVSLT